MEPKGAKREPKGAKKETKLGAKSGKNTVKEKASVLVIFQAFWESPNHESVWPVQCLLKVSTFCKRSAFGRKYLLKSFIFGRKCDEKRDKKASQTKGVPLDPPLGTLWLPCGHLGAPFGSFWYPFGPFGCPSGTSSGVRGGGPGPLDPPNRVIIYDQWTIKP